MQAVETDFTGEIHPAAALFPLLPDDELRELADDITANGLIHPVVLDPAGALIDGRNRLAACRMAGVAPAFTVYDGDAVAYVLSANVSRRSLSKGQKAMATVLGHRFSFNENGQQALARSADVSAGYVGMAEVVTKYADELAPAVMAGTVSLNDAYEEARVRKGVQRVRAEQEKHAERDLSALRAGAPDLAELVAEERMPLTAALTAWREREQEQQEREQRTTTNFAQGLALLYGVTLDRPERVAEMWLPDENPKAVIKGVEHLWTVEGVRAMARSLDRVADAFEARGGLQ